SGGNGPDLANFRNHAGRPRLRSYVSEGAVSAVVEALLTIYTGHVEVDESVVVIAAGSHSHRIANALQAGFFGHIGECSVAVVAKDPVPVSAVDFFQRR